MKSSYVMMSLIFCLRFSYGIRYIEAGAKLTDNEIKKVRNPELRETLRQLLKEKLRREADHRFWVLKNQGIIAPYQLLFHFRY